jgi:hypothetical protein
MGEFTSFGDATDSYDAGNGVAVALYGSDQLCPVEFSMGDEIDHVKTAELGRQMFKSVPFISIRFPGDKTKEIERPVKLVSDAQGPADTQRWPRQWAQFQKGEKQNYDGLPISQWVMADRATVRNLNGANVFTVEQLAGVLDANLATLGHGGLELRKKAQAYLAQAGNAKAAADIQRAEEAANARADALQAKNAELEKRLAALESGPKLSAKEKRQFAAA